MATFAKINREHIVTQIVEVADAVATTEANGINFLRNLYKEPEATWVQTFTDGTRKHYAGKVLPIMQQKMLFLNQDLFHLGIWIKQLTHGNLQQEMFLKLLMMA